MNQDVARIQDPLQTPLQRQEFGASEREGGDVAAIAAAAREKAAVEARYVMAERHPRSIEEFRLLLEKECKRPQFAEDAIYEKPVGRRLNRATNEWEDEIAEGPSIRFIETALRCYRNSWTRTITVYESAEARVCCAMVTDLEANVTHETEFTVPKRVERRGQGKKKDQAPKGRVALGSRFNSSGEKTFLIEATDDETRIKQSALGSIFIRNNGRRILPDDIVKECMRLCKKTTADEVKDNPDAAKRRLIDNLNEQGVSPTELEAYLGHTLERVQPAEVEKLRLFYVALREGEMTWESIMLTKEDDGSFEKQQKVAEEKLASLRAKGKGKAKADKAGGSTPQAASTVAEGSPTEPQPEDGQPEELPALTENQMREMAAEADKPRTMQFGGKKN